MPAFCMRSWDKFSASVALEGLCPQRVAVGVVNDQDVFVSEAGYLQEKPHLIGVHGPFLFVDTN